MARISPPPNATPVGGGPLPPEWQTFFMAGYLSARLDYGSGTTAQRPTNDLRTGGRYFDTSLGALGKPIFVNKNGTGWVLADGTAA